MENDRAQYCVMCGTELNEFSGVFGSEQRHKNQKFIPFCRKCQQEYRRNHNRAPLMSDRHASILQFSDDFSASGA